MRLSQSDENIQIHRRIRFDDCANVLNTILFFFCSSFPALLSSSIKMRLNICCAEGKRPNGTQKYAMCKNIIFFMFINMMQIEMIEAWIWIQYLHLRALTYDRCRVACYLAIGQQFANFLNENETVRMRCRLGFTRPTGVIHSCISFILGWLCSGTYKCIRMCDVLSSATRASWPRKFNYCTFIEKAFFAMKISSQFAQI